MTKLNSDIIIPPKPRSLLLFFSLAFILSWIAWLPAALASHELLLWPVSPILTGVLGAFGPFIAAVVTARRFAGKAGLKALARRFLVWRVGWTWYAFVLGWPMLLSLTKTGVAVLFGGAPPDFGQPPFVRLYPLPPELLATTSLWVFLPFVFLQQMLLGSSMGEELGWRGYALPRLQANHSALRASLILGSLWSLWHFPLWLTKGQATPTSGLGWSVLGLMATTILFTWVYNNTNGSLLLALLFHTAIGLTNLFLAAADTHPLVEVGLTWALALLIIRRWGAYRLVCAGEQASTHRM
ncbi:MAG: CPBP family intramembrane glutamic endopeptidase [Caldilineaceae bacterium]